MFHEAYIHRADFPEVGELEAYPNGDAIRYIDVFGLGKTVKTMGRFGMRIRVTAGSGRPLRISGSSTTLLLMCRERAFPLGSSWCIT